MGEHALVIYDCFTFYNELDLLEVRLHELYDVVDRFVLVEATQTFQGRAKPLYYKENAKRFEQFADKIRHIVVEFPPGDLTSQLATRPQNANWAREHYQRDQIARGIANALPDDLIIVSDVDEIISAPKLREAIANRRPHDLTIFAMPIHTGSVNRRVHNDIWKKGPRMIEFAQFPGAEHLRLTKIVAAKRLGDNVVGRFYTRLQNYLLRGMANRLYVVPNSGWHMTSIGDWHRYRDKIRAYSQSERAHWQDFKFKDAYERRLSQTTTVVDTSELPKFIQENAARFELAS